MIIYYHSQYLLRITQIFELFCPYMVYINAPAFCYGSNKKKLKNPAVLFSNTFHKNNVQLFFLYKLYCEIYKTNRSTNDLLTLTKYNFTLSKKINWKLLVNGIIQL